MSRRMEEALSKGASCWKRAMDTAPEFVEGYLLHAENLLLCHEVVRGEQFTKNARDHGLVLPERLHHNTWVYGPRFLEQVGWVTKIGKVIPLEMHNHMPVVTLWRSNLTF